MLRLTAQMAPAGCGEGGQQREAEGDCPFSHEKSKGYEQPRIGGAVHYRMPATLEASQSNPFSTDIADQHSIHCTNTVG